MKLWIAAAIALVAAACGAPSENHQAAAQQPGRLTIEAAWAAPTPAGVDVSAGYLTIANRSSTDDRLLSATSPRAERVEVHEMTMDGGVMRMRPLNGLAAPAGQAVALGPGGTHLMFYGVSEPFAEGQTIPVQLTFETAGVINAELRVSRRAPQNHSAH